MPIGLGTEEMMTIAGQIAGEIYKRHPEMIHRFPLSKRPVLGQKDRGTVVLVTQEDNLVIPPDSTGVFTMKVIIALLDANNQRITEQLREAGVNIP